MSLLRTDGRWRIATVWTPIFGVAILLVYCLPGSFVTDHYLFSRIVKERDPLMKVVAINNTTALDPETWNDLYLLLCKDAADGLVREALAQLVLEREGEEATEKFAVLMADDLSSAQQMNVRAIAALIADLGTRKMDGNDRTEKR